MHHTSIDKNEIHANGTATVHYRFKEPATPSA